MFQPRPFAACAVVGALLLFNVSAYADSPRPEMQAQQSPATSPLIEHYADQQQQRQIVQPLNNAPVWSEVRAGAPQTTTVPGRETNVLIQPEGQTWRTLHNSIVSPLSGWSVVFMVIVIAALYKWKGTMPLHEPSTGRRIRRFNRWHMAIHWTTAWAFVALAISGIVINTGMRIAFSSAFCASSN